MTDLKLVRDDDWRPGEGEGFTIDYVGDRMVFRPIKPEDEVDLIRAEQEKMEATPEDPAVLVERPDLLERAEKLLVKKIEEGYPAIPVFW